MHASCSLGPRSLQRMAGRMDLAALAAGGLPGCQPRYLRTNWRDLFDVLHQRLAISKMPTALAAARWQGRLDLGVDRRRSGAHCPRMSRFATRTLLLFRRNLPLLLPSERRRLTSRSLFELGNPLLR